MTDHVVDYDLQQLGNRTISLSYDSKNRVSQVADSGGSGAQAWSYDVRGNVTDNGSVTLSYDMASQPTSIAAAGGNGAYTYDGNLKRAKIVRNGTTTYWIYSALTGTPIYRKEIGSGTSITHYLSVGGATLRIEDGVEEYTHLNHQGSPIAATNTAGNISWRESYLPYGKQLTDTAGNQNDIGYTGHVQDDPSDLIYMQARYYDPVVGWGGSCRPIRSAIRTSSTSMPMSAMIR